MTTPNPHRTQRRKHRRLFDAVAAAGDPDAPSFTENPHHNYRIRLATPHEAEAAQILDGITPGILALCPDAVILTLVRQLAPGVRVRRFVLGTLATAGEFPELIAREAWACHGEKRAAS